MASASHARLARVEVTRIRPVGIRDSGRRTRLRLFNKPIQGRWRLSRDGPDRLAQGMHARQVGRELAHGRGSCNWLFRGSSLEQSRSGGMEFCLEAGCFPGCGEHLRRRSGSGAGTARRREPCFACVKCRWSGSHAGGCVWVGAKHEGGERRAGKPTAGRSAGKARDGGKNVGATGSLNSRPRARVD